MYFLRKVEKKVLKKEKSIHIIELLWKKAGLESWSEKFSWHGKCKGYKKLLLSNVCAVKVDKIPAQDVFDDDLKDEADLN